MRYSTVESAMEAGKLQYDAFSVWRYPEGEYEVMTNGDPLPSTGDLATHCRRHAGGIWTATATDYWVELDRVTQLLNQIPIPDRQYLLHFYGYLGHDKLTLTHLALRFGMSTPQMQAALDGANAQLRKLGGPEAES